MASPHGGYSPRLAAWVMSKATPPSVTTGSATASRMNPHFELGDLRTYFKNTNRTKIAA